MTALLEYLSALLEYLSILLQYIWVIPCQITEKLWGHPSHFDETWCVLVPMVLITHTNF